jgi:hypothetical protein
MKNGPFENAHQKKEIELGDRLALFMNFGRKVQKKEEEEEVEKNSPSLKGI